MICGDRKPLDKWWPPSIQSHSCEILVSPQTIINTINISTKKSSPTKLLSFHCLDVRLKTQEYSCNTHYLRGANQNLAYSVHQSLPAINILSSLYHNHVIVFKPAKDSHDNLHLLFGEFLQVEFPLHLLFKLFFQILSDSSLELFFPNSLQTLVSSSKLSSPSIFF